MTRRTKKLSGGWLALTGVLVLAITLAGCGGNDPTTARGGLAGSFTINGSNTVTPLSSLWAEEFMKMNPRVNIAISGPGSGAGIAALINGTTDICQASRKMQPSEIDQARANGVEPYEIPVANDALSVVVHPTNPVSELSFAQLSAIYTGKITNWREVGGKDAVVVALSRDTNSGTHVFFREHVVRMAGLATADKSLEYGSRVLFLPSTEEGVSEVAGNPKAIFYSGLGYTTSQVKLLGIKKTAGDAAVLPSRETTLNGTYPISRPLLYYTNGAPAGLVKSFIDYCLSGEGQAQVVGVGYVPLR
ncbi:MAG: PstS family phosphate ABC transporter substrate-binding protein [Chloroflexota bacterium]